MPEVLTVAPSKSIRTRVAIAMLSIFFVSIWSLSFFASLLLRNDMEHVLGDQQYSTVSMLAADVNQELDVRFEALRTVALTMSPKIMGDTRALQALMKDRPVLQGFFNAGVIVYRPDGMAVAEYPPSVGRVGINYMDIDTISAALQHGQSTVGGPVIGKKLQMSVFGMTVPIRDTQGRIIGALSGVTNLGKPSFLDVVAENHYGKTGGYVLIAPKHNMVVTATEKTRIMERLSVSGLQPVADSFAHGREGASVFSYPGGEVLASGKRISAADWYVVAVLPTAEAFSPIYAMQKHMLLATVLLTLLAGAVARWLLHWQLAPMLTTAKTLATMAKSDQPPVPLAITRNDEVGQLIDGFNHLLHALAQRDEVLKLSQERLRAMMDNTNVLIFMKDLDGRYLFVNREYERMSLVQRTEILGKTDHGIFPSEIADSFVQNDRQVAQSGKALEVVEYVSQADGMHTYLVNKFPLRTSEGAVYAVCGIATDITERKRAEEEQRIAAVAFESQEGIVVMDASLRLLRVNRAFTQITGFSIDQIHAQTAALLKTDRHPDSFYRAVWGEVLRTGGWQGEMWVQRHDGEVFAGRGTISAVKDESGRVTHYVGNLVDATDSQLQEQERLRNEAAHREVLVREVHHRIKNNLQGITGLLRQFAQRNPEMADPINQAIGQVHGISVIHGLQGRASKSTVRLCELTRAIADEIQGLWQAPVAVDIPAQWSPYIVAEKEAVPMALVLNELILNAVKHADQSDRQVHITLRKLELIEGVQMCIANTGNISPEDVRSRGHHTGLKLITALMPHQGARLVTEQHGLRVVTLLELSLPVISPELKDTV